MKVQITMICPGGSQMTYGSQIRKIFAKNCEQEVPRINNGIIPNNWEEK